MQQNNSYNINNNLMGTRSLTNLSKISNIRVRICTHALTTNLIFSYFLSELTVRRNFSFKRNCENKEKS